MNRRVSNRVIVNLDAELIFDDVSYTVNIQNLSKDGIFVKSSITKTARAFMPGKKHDLHFQLPSGESIRLRCQIKWLHSSTLYKISTDNLLNSMGIEIIKPSLEYKAFVETLNYTKISTRKRAFSFLSFFYSH
jgi:hypothetical protein